MHRLSLRSAHGFRLCFYFRLCVPVCVIDVGGPADPIAPSIIIPPKNTSVTVGRNEAIMECVANARYIFTQTLLDTEEKAHAHTDMSALSKHLHLLSPLHLIFCDLNESWNLLFEHNRKVFCSSLILYLFSIFPFDSRLYSVLPILHNPSLEFWLLSPIQRLNQNDRCIPLLLQCSVTLKQNINLY